MREIWDDVDPTADPYLSTLSCLSNAATAWAPVGQVSRRAVRSLRDSWSTSECTLRWHNSVEVGGEPSTKVASGLCRAKVLCLQCPSSRQFNVLITLFADRHKSSLPERRTRNLWLVDLAPHGGLPSNGIGKIKEKEEARPDQTVAEGKAAECDLRMGTHCRRIGVHPARRECTPQERDHP